MGDEVAPHQSGLAPRLPHRLQERRALQQCGEAQHDVTDEEVARGLRGDELVDAVRDRHRSTRDEQAERGEQRPDVDLSPVAERMPRVGGPSGLPVRDDQEDLVAGVRPRVRGLGDHRRRSGQRGGERLGDRDQEVRDERDRHRERALRATIARQHLAHPAATVGDGIVPAGVTRCHAGRAGRGCGRRRILGHARSRRWSFEIGAAAGPDGCMNRGDAERGNGAVPPPKRPARGADRAHGRAFLGAQGRPGLVVPEGRVRGGRRPACGRGARIRRGARLPTAGRTRDRAGLGDPAGRQDGDRIRARGRLRREHDAQQHLRAGVAAAIRPTATVPRGRSRRLGGTGRGAREARRRRRSVCSTGCRRRSPDGRTDGATAAGPTDEEEAP